ncbi:hypothetical protein LIS04_211 [Listeria phage LIS04]|nr:hypothetical protein LIS04_211 [Listeria phage LIS04]
MSNLYVVLEYSVTEMYVAGVKEKEWTSNTNSKVQKEIPELDSHCILTAVESLLKHKFMHINDLEFDETTDSISFTRFESDDSTPTYKREVEPNGINYKTTYVFKVEKKQRLSLLPLLK